MERKPKIAILRWEQGLVPEGLRQLEEMPGNSTNRKSYPFPVKLVEVKGACVDTVITHPSKKILGDMIDISRGLVEKDGIRAISTSCGFNAVFQRALSDNLNVPVFTSALLEVPFAANMIGKNRAVGVITANKGSLTEEHFHACGIDDDMNMIVLGLEKAKEWSKIFSRPDEPFDMGRVTEEIIGVAVEGVKEYPEIGAIVLECTDLPPYARKISETVGLPVFDFISMMGHVAMSLGEVRLF